MTMNMSDKYSLKILNSLLDKYENSKTFVAKNQVNQRFSISIASLFKKYNDASKYELFTSVNEAIRFLELRDLVIPELLGQSNKYKKAYLNSDNLENAYRLANRMPKKDINLKLAELVKKYSTSNSVLKNFCISQLKRIEENRPIQFFNSDFKEFENILKAVEALFNVKEETFERDFSVGLFNDSKAFEKISSKVVNLIYEYNKNTDTDINTDTEFPEKDKLLEALNIVKNPGYVNCKGSGIINLSGQMLDLSALNGAIALSTGLLNDIASIDVTNKKIITIENLTSFHSFSHHDMFIIYLGGYHNKIRRDFIKKIHEKNPDAQFFHFGDIDAGGFYILEHLKNKTGLDFKPWKMDIPTLEKYKTYTKPLTASDRKRLERLMDSPHRETVQYMLENDCKLEQEAVDG